MLNTCSKQEAISVYNEIVQKLKNKKSFFGMDVQRDIDNIKFLDISDDKKKEARIKGIVLNEMNNDKIQSLKNEIDLKLGVKSTEDSGFRDESPKGKIKKLRKKIKKKLKVVDTQPKESEA